MKQGKRATTRAKASSWVVVKPLLDAMYLEFKELSKKNPQAAISKGKVKVVNRVLDACRQVLADEASLVFLDLLDEDDLPLNSDVTLALSQYCAAMNQYRDTYYGWHTNANSWVVEDGYMEDSDDLD